MQTIELVEDMRAICEKLRNERRKISLVPTMGALHSGHARLIELAAQSGGEDLSNRQQTMKAGQAGWNSLELGSHCVVVSIFVNPKQFNDTSDFQNYPNTMAHDLEMCSRLGVSYVFAPKASEIYPEGSTDLVTVTPPIRLATELEGKSRPGHFDGVLTIVCKLFNIIRPNMAFFGEKDYQQLILVSQMVKDLDMDIQICPVPTVRDHDMLPLSSRNIRLNPRQRELAPIMYRILQDAKNCLESSFELSQFSGHTGLILEASMMVSMLTSISLAEEINDLVKVDYLELRCATDLSKVQIYHDEAKDGVYFDCDRSCAKKNLSVIFRARLLISVLVGSTRLLDNIEILL